MRYEIRDERGVALLVVLFIVMAITILSLGFLSRSDVELACGENMILRTQMDYLAESGLEHARGLILNDNDFSEDWTALRQQLYNGNDYYDVTVSRDGPNLCNYIITCDAYREKNGEKTGRSSLEAELRFNPCIAYWAGASTTIWQRITINGDVYCNGNVSGNGYIGGDVFATGGITGTNIEGQINEASQAPVDWPGLEISYFSPGYYIASDIFSAYVSDSNAVSSFNYSEDNPAGVCYYSGDINLPGNVSINGMLVVDGDLRVIGANNTITAVKNFPALLVSGEVVVEDGGALKVEGLVQIGQKMVLSSGAENVDIDGGLFIVNGAIEGSVSSSVTVDITAAPAIASIQIRGGSGNTIRWSPAAGAFFRSIERN